MYYRVKYASQIRDRSILTLFFDFYVLNEIWFRTVGMEQYGYTPTKILPHRKAELIDETFKSKLATIKGQLVSALEASVRREIRHWTYNTRVWEGCEPIPGTEDDWTVGFYERACKRFGLRANVGESTLRNLPLIVIRELFSVKCWDRCYGGPRWAKATDLLIQLKASKTIKDDVFLIDQIFDLQHNTGFILNKTVFAILDDKKQTSRRTKNKNTKYYVKPLNLRFLGSLDELIENVSPLVRNIYFANRNYVVA